jgi:hypothetical protein
MAPTLWNRASEQPYLYTSVSPCRKVVMLPIARPSLVATRILTRSSKQTTRFLNHWSGCGAGPCLRRVWSRQAEECLQERLGPAFLVAHSFPLRAMDLPLNGAAMSRPRFCAMSNRKLRALGIAMLTWRAALADHLPLATRSLLFRLRFRERRVER